MTLMLWTNSSGSARTIGPAAAATVGISYVRFSSTALLGGPKGLTFVIHQLGDGLTWRAAGLTPLSRAATFRLGDIARTRFASQNPTS